VTWARLFFLGLDPRATRSWSRLSRKSEFAGIMVVTVVLTSAVFKGAARS